MPRRVAAEAVGSLLLAATVIGSGIMAERLAGGNAAVALLANTGATVAALGVLIALFGPVSGAHLNPAVTLVMVLRRAIGLSEGSRYVLAQLAGCCIGAVLANTMFDLPPVQLSTHIRSGASQWLGEFVATFGLLLLILGHRWAHRLPWLVAAWIGAAYWFTSSTSFANPAITLARSLSDTFAGIRPADVGPFVLSQLAGAIAALLVARWMFSTSAEPVLSSSLQPNPRSSAEPLAAETGAPS
jgi:glycerol uptake facilitator-like aquaporin